MIKDPNMLLSIINTKLRDEYDSLDSLCDNLDYDYEEVIELLKSIGYEYSSELNQFKIK